jgi:hypothetical protein
MEALLGTSFAVFIGLTVVIVGGTAIMTGRAIAANWRPVGQVVFASVGLTLFDRFLVYALFQGDLFHLGGIVIHFILILILALIAYRITRVHMMVAQYPWRYQQTSPWSYRDKAQASGQT